MGTPLPVAIEVRDASPADIRMRRIRADIAAIMPAALALCVRARAHTQRDARQHRLNGVGSAALLDTRLRGNEYEPEIVVERAQELRVFTVCVQCDFAGKRRADAPGGAQGLELPLHIGSQRTQPLPAL